MCHRALDDVGVCFLLPRTIDGFRFCRAGASAENRYPYLMSSGPLISPTRPPFALIGVYGCGADPPCLLRRFESPRLTSVPPSVAQQPGMDEVSLRTDTGCRIANEEIRECTA